MRFRPSRVATLNMESNNTYKHKNNNNKKYQKNKKPKEGIDVKVVSEVLFVDRVKSSQLSDKCYCKFDGNRCVLVKISKKEFSESDLPCFSYKKMCVKFFQCERKFAVDCARAMYDDVWEAQVGVLSGVYNLTSSIISKTIASFEALKQLMMAMNDAAFVPLILDIVAMISSLSSPMPNFDSLLVRVLRTYSIYLRGRDLFAAQSIEEALMMAALVPFLPQSLVDIIKRMQLFTSKKVLDAPGLLLDFFGDVGKFVSSLLETLPMPEVFKGLVNKIFSIGYKFKYTNSIRRLLTLWRTNKRIITEMSFSKEVENTWNELSTNYDVKQFLVLQKKTLWDDFVRLHKAVLSYNNVNRVEPFCMIFEGPAGVKKSYLMNKLIQYDRESTYVHVVKSIMDGKDFYDSYDNETYFVMDDVGQMSITQWRSIINMVSTVKLPLDCAEAPLKDTKFFNSEVIFATTNKFTGLHGLTKNDGIDNLEALWRRGHVISFENVVRRGGLLEGRISYKRYDVNSSTWVSSFINGVLPSGFPNSVSAVDEEKVVAWLSVIVKSHREFFSNLHADVDITDSQRSVIDDYKKSLEQLEHFYEAQGMWNWSVDNLVDVKDVISEALSDVLDFALSGISELYAKLSQCSIKTLLLTVSMILVIVCLMYSVYNLFFGEEAEVKATVLWKKELDRFKAQGLESSNVVDTLQSRMMVIELHKDDGTCQVIQGLVSGLCVLVPYHVTVKGVISISAYLNFNQVDNGVKCLDHVKVDLVYANKSADLAILRLPEYFASPFKCCKKLLSRKKCDRDMKRLYFVNCHAAIPLARMFVSHSEDIEYYSSNYSNVLTPENCVVYELSKDGLCGSLIVDQNAGIVGMHVAGTSVKGASIIYDVTTLNEIYTILEKNVVAYKEIPPIRADKMEELEDFSGAILESKYHITVPKTTNFVESPLLKPILSHTKLDLKQPVNLQSHGDGTIHEMAKKSFVPCFGYTKDELDFVDKVMDVLIPEYKDIDMRTVLKGNDYLPSFNMRSVNGYGYKKEKKTYLDVEHGVVTPEFQEILDEFEQAVKNKTLQVDDVLLYETMKDELRAPHKRDKPRTFRIAQLHIIYLMKRTFGDLVCSLIVKKWENGIAIGMNPYADWEKLYEILRPLKVFDGDTGEWDGRQPSELQDALSRGLNRKYVGEYPELNKFLCEFLVRVLVAIMNKLIATTHSVSTGHWLTAMGNSLLNRLHTAVCYYRTFKKQFPHKEPTVSDFLRIKDFVLGDDKLVGVPHDMSYLNAVSMRDYFESLGMTFTDANKQRISKEFSSLQEVTFLKRRFAYHPVLKKIMCPLDLMSIYSSLGYFDKTKDYDIVMKGKVESAQRELWLHGLDYTWLLAAARQSGIVYTALSDEYMVNLYRHEPDLAWKLYLLDSGKISSCYDSM